MQKKKKKLEIYYLSKFSLVIYNADKIFASNKQNASIKLC